MRSVWIVVLSGAVLFIIGFTPVLAQEKSPPAMPEQLQKQEQVFGWQLMTEQERLEHRQKMQQMKTEEEREAFRREHHEKMQERARQQGVTLPEEPALRGKGMGPGGGMGPGKGPGMGSGMGPRK